MPAMIGLEAHHGVFCVLVPFPGGLAVEVFFTDQCRLDVPGALLVNALLAMTLPRAVAS